MNEPRRVRRLLVAIDAHNEQWREQLRYAARLARAMDAELHTLFIEDEDLQAAAELPFTVEISMRQVRRERFSPEDVARMQRYATERIRRDVEEMLRETRLKGGFATARRRQMLQASQQGDVFWLQSRSRVVRLPVQAPAPRDTLYVVYTDEQSDENLLAVTHRLMENDYCRLVVFNMGDIDDDRVRAMFADLAKPVDILALPQGIGLESLLGSVENRSGNTLLLPGSMTGEGERERLPQALAAYRFEILLVQ